MSNTYRVIDGLSSNSKVTEVTSVCVIGIYVHDMEKARKFYCDSLGFKVKNEYEDGCIIQLEHDGPTLILEKVENMSQAKYPGHSQIVLGLETENIEQKSKELKSKGIEFIIDEPTEFVAGQFMVMKDPSGNILELLQFNQ
jgi:lactoylglutathione lyase